MSVQLVQQCKLLTPQNNLKVSMPLSENIQIGPKVSIFCVATIIFEHCLPLGHGVHQKFTGCHWSPLPLLHDIITELVDVRDLALLHLPFEDVPQASIGFRSGDMNVQSITFTLRFFSKAVVVIILEYCPVAQSLLQYVTVHVGIHGQFNEL